jgi:hypothetical protein
MKKAIAEVKIGQVRSPGGQFLNLRSDWGFIIAEASTLRGVIAVVRCNRAYTFGVWATEQDYEEFLQRGHSEVWRAE